jgi:hypothetical protein
VDARRRGRNKIRFNPHLLAESSMRTRGKSQTCANA